MPVPYIEKETVLSLTQAGLIRLFQTQQATLLSDLKLVDLLENNQNIYGYYVFKNAANEVLYIGKSVRASLMERIPTHLESIVGARSERKGLYQKWLADGADKDKDFFNSVSLFVLKDEYDGSTRERNEDLKFEIVLISSFNPKYNLQHKNRLQYSRLHADDLISDICARL
jgi:hypothetical protein